MGRELQPMNKQQPGFAEITPNSQTFCRDGCYCPNCRSGSGYSQRSRYGDCGMVLRLCKIMLSDFTRADKVYITCGYTDRLRGIDGLVSIVQESFQLNPFTNTLFLFCGRRRDRMTALY